MPRIKPYLAAATGLAQPANPSDEEFSEDDSQSGGAGQLFENYMAVCAGLDATAGQGEVFEKGISRVREFLSSGHESAVCLICLGSIRPTEAIWHCSASCFAVLHLTCIQEWARNQRDAAVLRASLRLPAERFPGAADATRQTAEWGCPKCRHSYPAADIPRRYTCFCGKRSDPEFDPWLLPHSCGELCGKQLPGGCEHSCLLLCHPGPCPPCPLIITASCYCGGKEIKRRCGAYEFSCGSACSRALPCGHPCAQACHAGDCAACGVRVSARCRCGAEERVTQCSERLWQCARVCSKPLACGRHKCDLVCHAGQCGDCPNMGARTCPCGKTSYQGLPCDQRAPACGETCGRLLACGVHSCSDRCHYGECSKVCRVLVTKPCRCGKTQKSVQCQQEVLCDIKCAAMRSCGRHACKRRCCDGNCPPCEEVCGRKLRCGNHKCPAPCHTGPCRPCPLTLRVWCACGHTGSSLPCGAEAQAVAPRCNNACPVPGLCRHSAAARPHRCHFGACPPCRQPCGAIFSCSHTCALPACHDPAPPAIPDFTAPKPPQPNALLSLDTLDEAALTPPTQGPALSQAVVQGTIRQPGGPAASPCPACQQPLSVPCFGRHSQQQLPCCAAAEYDCGQPCGRPLACGNHSCSLSCHRTPDAAPWSHPAAANTSTGASHAREPCEVCRRACERPRACAHPCPLPCHRGDCPACTVPVRVPCACGKTSLQLDCNVQQALAASSQADPDRPSSAAAGSTLVGGRTAAEWLSCGKPCHRALPFCPHPCRLPCHAGPCPDQCEEEVVVRCNCKRVRQKWSCSRVQDALQAAGRPRLFGTATPLRLVECDAECAAQSRGQEAVKSPEGPEAPEEQAAPLRSRSKQKTAAPDDATGAAVAVPAATGSSRKLSRQEREALAARKEAERLAKERRQRLLSVLFWLGLLLAGLLLGLGLVALLSSLDRLASARWGRPQ